MKQARQRNKVKTGPIIVLVALMLVGVFFGIQQLKSSGALGDAVDGVQQKSVAKSKKARAKKGIKTIKVAVVTWGGYAGGQYFNEGFEASEASRFAQDYGFEVEFILEDDPAKSLEMWKNDEVQLHWYTADAFATILPDIGQYDPKIVFQSDWSRKGDAIVASPLVKSVADLKGKRVAVAPKTPSQSLLIKTLEANNMSLSDIQLVEVATAIDAAEAFKEGEVDAAVVWSPDDEICLNEVRGAKILTSTGDATHIIADIFFAKGVWVENNGELLRNLITGWLTGNAEINASSSNKAKAVGILAKGLDQNDSDCRKAIDNVRLATFGDNKNFFKMNSNYKGITGEDVYKDMGKTYAKLGYAPSNLPKWKEISNRDALRGVELNGSIHKAEPVFTFATDVKGDSKKTAFATKNVTINFASGASTLDETSKYTIDKQVSKILQTFGGVKVRVEGNTDSQGSRSLNKSLSLKRAQSVVNYLVSEYGFNRNKFIAVGNGPDKPVSNNNTSAGRAKNRRTEIKFIK